jgi:beta-phosphoglucomutase
MMGRLFDVDAMLFDLDGLLVDTERLHWQAYRQMCEHFGCKLDWEFPLYLQIAGGSAGGIREKMKEEIPQLFEGRSWEQLYDIKRQKLFDLLAHTTIPLMKGVAEALPALANNGVPMVVVTHSPKAFVDLVRSAHPLFSLMSSWVYREMYNAPKPDPDGYLRACQEVHVVPNRAVGFEDTIRGIESLVAAKVQPVLINANDPSAQSYCKERGISTFSSFDEMMARE